MPVSKLKFLLKLKKDWSWLEEEKKENHYRTIKKCNGQFFVFKFIFPTAKTFER